MHEIFYTESSVANTEVLDKCGLVVVVTGRSGGPVVVVPGRSGDGRDGEEVGELRLVD